MAKKNVASKEPKLKITVNHALTTLYTIVMFTVFPLFLTNYYTSARRDKFWLYVVVTSAVAVSVLIVAIAQYATRNSVHNQKLNIYRDPLKFNLTDIGILAFLGVTILSTIDATFSSATPGTTFNALFLGSYGRNMGLLMILMMAAGYLVVSRYFFYQKYVFYFIFTGMTVVSLLAVINFYRFDPLGIFEAYKSNNNVQQNFTSTIGNKNYLSAMICVALPFSIGMSIATKDKILKIISYVSTGIQFMGLLVATSDGGFLGCFIAIAVMLIVVSRDLKKLAKLFFSLAVMMASAKLLWLFDLIMKGNNKGYTSFSELFVYSNMIFVLIPVFFGLAVLFDRINDEGVSKYTFIGFTSLVVIGGVAVVALFIYYSLINTEATLSSFTKFFRFNAKWGTHRGYFWIKSFELFKDFTLWEMLFGTGPDTFYNVFKVYFDELHKMYGDTSTNAAHSVYINYLITEGILGMGTYLLFVVSAIRNAVKGAKENPLSLVCLGVIVAYAAQDIVNIANPVNTPWFIMFIALSEATRLKANSTERLLSEKF